MMVHFAVGVIFSIVLSVALAAYTEYRTFWFWFILLQTVSLIQTAWGGVYGWLVWKLNEKKVIAKFKNDFKAAGFPPYTGGGIFFVLEYLEQVSNAPQLSNSVKQLAHQVIVTVRTLNDLKKTTERERYLNAVSDAIWQLSQEKS